MSDITDHAGLLSTLARAAPERLKAMADDVLDALGEIDVLQSRTGLVMLPMRETRDGVAFHMGEVLMSEAHIQHGDAHGYGMRRGRDLEAAMAMAVIDLAMAVGVKRDACLAFCADEADRQAQADAEVLRQVEATRVNMETF